MMDVVANSGMAKEFEGAELGDLRRSHRLTEVAEALGRNPALSFPKALGGDAALEGTYRLLSNEHVTADAILRPHVRATAERAKAFEEVTVVHDTSAFSFRGVGTRAELGRVSSCEKTQGFLT